MDLKQFIYNNNLTDFNKFKNIIESTPYFLKIKEDINFPNIFLIHTTENSDLNYKLVRECNGIIIEKNTYKILCYTFDKCYEDLNENFDYDNLYIESCIEGTLIRLYFYNNKWMVSTKRCIDATKSKWLSDKNFFELFLECTNINLMETLNKNHCYSFVLAHPENSIVVKYNIPILFHISTRNLETLNEVLVNVDIGCQYLMKSFLNKNNLNEFKNSILIDESLNDEGYIMIDKNYNRCKIKKPYFCKVRELWGNTNNRFIRYLELRKDDTLLANYLYFFGQDKQKFIDYEIIVRNLCTDIYTLYHEKHIKKNNVNIPYYYSQFIYKLHGNYLKDKVLVNYYKVMKELFDLKPNKISFMIQHAKKNNQLQNNESMDL